MTQQTPVAPAAAPSAADTRTIAQEIDQIAHQLVPAVDGIAGASAGVAVAVTVAAPFLAQHGVTQDTATAVATAGIDVIAGVIYVVRHHQWVLALEHAVALVSARLGL